MNADVRHLLHERMAFRETTGGDKIMALSDAVRRFVSPGMILQTGTGMATPIATYFEIARQFWGRNPGFTLVGVTGGAYTFALYTYGKLCRKIISAYNGDGYPFPSPNPILTRALTEKTIEVEYWTHLTITQRLMAGALGVPAFPTKSVGGSSLEQDNSDRFCRIPDPFGSGETLNLVKALNPDVSMVHGWAADAEGNTLIAAPYGGNNYGALAAKEGVIVTAERIVDADFIRRYSYMTHLPGYVVKAVCHAPMGAHPIGHHALGLPEFEGYGEDEEFVMEAREASKKPETYQAWVDKWILGCRDHEAFLARLGQKRIWFLKGRIQNDSWESELTERDDRLPVPAEATDAERIVHAASGKLHEIIKGRNYRLGLCGIGISNLAAWMAYYRLRQEGYPFELVAEIGFYGYSPKASDPFIFNLRNTPTCRMISDIFTVLGIMMCGATAASIGVLGAAQVDRFGNVNTTRLSDSGPFLVGSGGANDVASGASENVITLMQNKMRFVKKVPYVTSPGQKVTAVVSQWGVFEKALGEDELALTAYYPIGTSGTEEEAVRAIREECGWPLKVREPLQALPLPSADDLAFMRAFDPKRLFLGGI